MRVSVGTLDLAAWVRATLDGGGGGERGTSEAALETLGMDEDD